MMTSGAELDVVEAVKGLRFPQSDKEREERRIQIFQHLWDKMGEFGENPNYPASLFLANNAEIPWVSATILGDELRRYVDTTGESDPGMVKELQIAIDTASRFLSGENVPEHEERRHDLMYEGFRI